MKSETIVTKLKNGDIETLKIIYELFYKRIFQAAYFVTGDIDLAEDVVQEVFLTLKNKIHQLADPSKLGSWLCRMSANKARNIIRHLARSSLVEDVGNIYKEEQLMSPETAVVTGEKSKEIIKMINRLTPEHRQLIYLKYYKDLTLDKISNVTGVPKGTVKSRLYYARREIKRLWSYPC
ncbi:RNA polymerase sigma factor [Desulforamulus ruminis]|uniref:RNA polymerase sigma factor, sigma-70 family n=1 Tax=Desulforamulus ruminis (strain ATCC 23193 / DSM 2154 / NCIMB 8452 / DL) TaxID=696281 RepID=F6DLG1_DESRL|nr:RNA polymerase sigma factor [Desulforamulus ruminis]AEG60509.1 RNA polymerase sigma factor, sigma-70 family [Desulforamulus ruminis DSM 2154]